MLPLLPGTALSFLLTCVIIELTPGPNMTYLAMVSASEGRKVGFATVAGVALGLFDHRGDRGAGGDRADSGLAAAL